MGKGSAFCTGGPQFESRNTLFLEIRDILGSTRLKMGTLLIGRSMIPLIDVLVKQYLTIYCPLGRHGLLRGCFGYLRCYH